MKEAPSLPGCGKTTDTIRTLTFAEEEYSWGTAGQEYSKQV